MKSSNIQQALTGDKLIELMHTAKDMRQPLADGLIYQHTITMIAADPGVGKSTIFTQMAIEMSSGLPVFGLFAVAKPLKVLYMQTERPILEFLERAEIINEGIPINKDMLVITDEYKVFNLLLPDHVDTILECIQRDCPDVEVIFVDPIYPLVSGGLSKDEPASAFTKAMSLVQKVTGAALIYSHHTSRQTMHNGQMVEKDDPFYGSQWIKAHVTASFHLKKTERGVKLLRKKDNYNVLPHEIALEYDSETELCSVPKSEIPAFERIKSFFHARILDKKVFSFNDIKVSTGLCNRTIRKMTNAHSFKRSFLNVSTKGNKHLYQASTEK